LLARSAVERQPHARLFELGRHAHAQALEQLDALGVGHERAALESGAEIRPRRARRCDELLGRLRGGIELIDLALQRLELGERELARPAFGTRCALHAAVGAQTRRPKRLDARARQRRQQNVRRRGQVVL
jgi:hypothetical protein